ncbi:NUDIX hydrolase [Shewanella aestuarii]|uniref:Phosphatase NudJ n=1 Tax=Shewanella aestuarii TaxID=1028752 RepID=A0A6G9QJN8_9GAMM|nr:NUDIX hydrolase [Shewanella aestuarii]QIR14770.1 NUDIX hydrolase [Shewanella aestuarii]
MNERYKPNTTVAMVIHCNDHFLLVEELIDNQTKFNQPAGHIEANESIIEACQREVFEETGLVIEATNLVGIYQYTANPTLAFIRYTFCASLPVMVKAQPQDSSIIRTHWFTREQIEQKSAQLRSPLVLKTIDDFIAQRGQHTPTTLLNSDYL